MGQIGQDGTAAERRTLIDQLADQRLLVRHDRGQADVLIPQDKLAEFAATVSARLGVRRPSVAKKVLDCMTTLDATTQRSILRALAGVARDNHLRVLAGKPGQAPLISVRPLSGPKLPPRWLLPWLVNQPELMRNLLERARAKDATTGLIVAVHRQDDGADDSVWGPLVQAAGYDPAEVKRLWLSSSS
ncbi:MULTISPECIES: hypothetical protein [unclassified Crossiella]|uniref:hypothetical protein n=1 Tax=unclassified Crossiella TaxID=2620835 RepID=UPI001FFEF6B6|nr:MULTISPECIES: hypothetical protein [unclassified Crossiella]MCK2240687.1 hypothetical protein [Crossiella sp. S99.2]MCK2252862.1 hypothetical protein [Crossiella sp. S99.1]